VFDKNGARMGLRGTSLAAEMKFDIPQMYKFHEQKSVDVEVDLLRLRFDSTRYTGS
jgi:predicted RNA methylase